MKTIIVKIAVICAILFILSLFHPPENDEALVNAGIDAEKSLEEYDGGCVVLNYHLVRSDNPLAKLKRAVFGYNYIPLYNIYESEFAREMKVLHDKGIAVYSLDELVKMMDENKVPNYCVSITFDDIDQSVYNTAYPILKEYGFPFSIFVVTGKLPNDDEVKQEDAATIKKFAEDDLVTVGLHTDQFHEIDELTGQPYFIDPRNNDKFADDTKTSIKKYEELLGETPKYFAYPHGFGTVDTDQILKENGLDVLFSLRGGAVDSNTDQMFIPRVLVSPQAFDATIEWLEKTK